MYEWASGGVDLSDPNLPYCNLNLWARLISEKPGGFSAVGVLLRMACVEIRNDSCSPAICKMVDTFQKKVHYASIHTYIDISIVENL